MLDQEVVVLKDSEFVLGEVEVWQNRDRFSFLLEGKVVF